MIKKLFILSMAAALAACSSDTLFTDAATSDGEVELTGVKASVEAGNTTRAAGVVYLEDRISRYRFVPSDKMTFTKIERSSNPIKRFQYKDVAFNSNASGAWERDKSTGYNLEEDAGGHIHPDVHPERVYWSDATSPHTFVGYSLPKDNSAFDWKKSAYYYDKEGTQHQFETYYGAIGDPLEATEVIDYNPATVTTETITVTEDNVEKPLTFGYSQKLRDEDLLLTYDNQLTADNSVANIKYYHALSSVRVIVNISGFYGTETDAYSTVSNMILHNQPTLYRWKQQSAAVDALMTRNENTSLNSLWGTGAPAYNQRKNIKLWNTKPEGDGQGASKTFTFYGITVPQTEDYFSIFTVDKDNYKKLEMSFSVSYPDPMKNDPVNKKITKTYQASLANPVMFYPGKCTTIHITLNHRDESMTVGASYQDWEYVETPDEGALKKKDTFLSKAPALANRDQAGVTIVGDQKATADDATWLYEKMENGTGTGQIYDIYGHDGSETSPYTISTANQLLSFAYEVQNGRNFAGKYVSLDADITLQPTASLPTKTVGEGDDAHTETDYSKLVSWIGIGTETAKFEGIFYGNGRHINNLYGKPFFGVIGQYAVVNKVSFANLIEVNGCGVVAQKNEGLLCGINIEGAIKADASEQYAGSIVGDNESFIVACTHVGSVEMTHVGSNGTSYVGGLVGRNNGTIIASYHSGNVTAPADATVHATVGYVCKKENGGGENDSQVFSCYYNNAFSSTEGTLVPGKTAYPRSTAQMQSNSFVNSTSEIITSPDGTETAKRHYSLNKALKLYKQWIDGIVESIKSESDDYVVKTNCHDFTKRQVLWLQQHYNQTHKFQYTPGAYPKIQ